jgi:cysteinyl-tRNA synthetase
MVVRYYFIMHHYRSPLEFSFELLTVAQKSYGRLVRLFADISDNTTNVSQTSVLSERILSCVTDDLNTPAALGVIFENIHDIADNMHERIAIKHLVQTIFGLTLQPLPVTHTVMTDEIQKLLEERRVARQNRDWARADILRKELKEYGIDVRDEKL